MPTLTGSFNQKLLIRLRVERGWSAQKAATEIGLTTQGLLNLELGRAKYPRADTLAAIARVYGVRMDDFYSGRPR